MLLFKISHWQLSLLLWSLFNNFIAFYYYHAIHFHFSGSIAPQGAIPTSSPGENVRKISERMWYQTIPSERYIWPHIWVCLFCSSQRRVGIQKWMCCIELRKKRWLTVKCPLRYKYIKKSMLIIMIIGPFDLDSPTSSPKALNCVSVVCYFWPRIAGGSHWIGMTQQKRLNLNHKTIRTRPNDETERLKLESGSTTKFI